MPRYFFDIVDGHQLVDPAGVDCVNDDAAERQAHAIANQIAMDIPARAVNRRVSVLNEDGREIVSIGVGK
jgi:hypothetical protein